MASDVIPTRVGDVGSQAVLATRLPDLLARRAREQNITSAEWLSLVGFADAQISDELLFTHVPYQLEADRLGISVALLRLLTVRPKLFFFHAELVAEKREKEFVIRVLKPKTQGRQP